MSTTDSIATELERFLEADIADYRVKLETMQSFELLCEYRREFGVGWDDLVPGAQLSTIHDRLVGARIREFKRQNDMT